MNKPVYLGLAILEVNKAVMYVLWYDYVKLKYGKKVKLCYLDTDSILVYIKIEDIYVKHEKAKGTKTCVIKRKIIKIKLKNS